MHKEWGQGQGLAGVTFEAGEGGRTLGKKLLLIVCSRDTIGWVCVEVRLGNSDPGSKWLKG